MITFLFHLIFICDSAIGAYIHNIFCDVVIRKVFFWGLLIIMAQIAHCISKKYKELLQKK